MDKRPLHQIILEIFRNNPQKVFTTKDLSNIYEFSYQKQSKKELITMILSRLHKQKIIHRTPTQLTNGYYYSKENILILKKIYQIHLVPYRFNNKELLCRELIKNSFEDLKTNSKLNLQEIENQPFFKKYGPKHFTLQNTQIFLSLLVAFSMCDGSINKKVNRARFYFRRKSDAEKFKAKVLKHFYLEIVRVSPSADKSCYIVQIMKGVAFARFLHKLGAPKGNKTMCAFLIPHWIYYGPDEIKRVFVSTVIGNEGSAPSNKRWRIQFVLSKNKENIKNLIDFINQIRTMLAHFHITTSHIQLRKQKGRKFHTRFYIKGRQDIHKFYKSFSFLYASEKQEVLENLIDSQDVEYAMIM